MPLGVDRFVDRLNKLGIEPSYFFYGEEPLQLLECGDALRKRAVDQDIVERLVFDIENASDWDAIEGESSAMSLFAERRLIEVRLGSRKPDKRGAAILEAIVTRDSSDDVFLISAGRLDAGTRKTKWFKALEKHTVCVATYGLKAAQIPGWLNRRATRLQKRLSNDAAALIAERVEGNLLAAAQELEKLCLLVDSETIDAHEVIKAVGDHARYDVYQLVDAVVGGDLVRALRVVRGLREEGTEPVIVVWALGRELRQLTSMAAAVDEGASVNAVMDQYHVWNARKDRIGAALRRNSLEQLSTLLCYANYIDTVIKGGRQGSPWDDIEILVLRWSAPTQAAQMVPSF